MDADDLVTETWVPLTYGTEWRVGLLVLWFVWLSVEVHIRRFVRCYISTNCMEMWRELRSYEDVAVDV